MLSPENWLYIFIKISLKDRFRKKKLYLIFRYGFDTVAFVWEVSMCCII